MKIYTLEVTVHEGGDEFWEAIQDRDGTGCDEVVQTIRDILSDAGFYPPDCTVTLKQFQDP